MASLRSRICCTSIHSLPIDRFKLLFGPNKGTKPGLHCPLPPEKTKEDVLSDYLQYLYDCSKDFIQGTHSDGVFLWTSLHGDAQFILSHPATWGGTQHDVLRKCMVWSGLLPDTHSSRIAFVSEGEANLHYIMRHRHQLGLQGDVSHTLIRTSSANSFLTHISAEWSGHSRSRRWCWYCRHWLI